MKQILKEPLLHFFLLGASLFILFSLIPKSNGRGELGKITITQGQCASILESFLKTRQRPPTREEWEGLIRARVREEVYYREALTLGLDKDDTIIRRRLLQKMEFITDDRIPQTPPTDFELNAYLQAHADTFRAEPHLTFRQLYLNPEKHGANLARDVERLLSKLNRPGGESRTSARGDPLPLDSHFTAVPASDIAKQFGEEFSSELGRLELGHWQGPVKSVYGVHVVCVTQRTESRAPQLADVRDIVRREMEESRRQEANDKFYQDLLTRYTVTIEPSQEAEKEKSLEGAK